MSFNEPYFPSRCHGDNIGFVGMCHRESRDGSGVRDLRPGMVGATRSDREPRAHIQRPESSETGAGSTMRVDLITVPQVGVYTIDVNAVKRNVFIKKRND